MGTDSIEPVEWDAMDNPFTKLIPIFPSDGEVGIPSVHGIETEIDLDMLAFYQWNGSSYVLAVSIPKQQQQH